jgi:hypothetical protein
MNNNILKRAPNKREGDKHTWRRQEQLFPDVDREAASLESGGHLICTKCDAISVKKHWLVDVNLRNTLQADPAVHKVVCPGCNALEKEEFQGEVILTGSLGEPLKQGLLGLIKHTAEKCARHNPNSRMLVLEADENNVHLMTTTRWLALRIGKEVEKAFKGHLEKRIQARERFVRLKWTA